jgi:hypothetical protein
VVQNGDDVAKFAVQGNQLRVDQVVAHQAIGDETAELLDLAYHYEPYWSPYDGQRLKTLLLFFDGIALTVPKEIKDYALQMDPVVGQPLAEQGLLIQLDPENLMDAGAAQKLADVLESMLTLGAFQGLGRHRQYEKLSFSRTMPPWTVGFTDSIVDKLEDVGLARLNGDETWFYLHPEIREFVLAMLPQIFKEAAARNGYALHPTTAQSEDVEALTDMLDQPPMATAGHVVTLDLQQVTLDLSSIPLDEVLDFRRTHGAAHRAYERDLRRFLREMTTLDTEARGQAIDDRRAELADAAADLLRASRKAWKRPLLALGLGIAGSAVSFATGNPVAAAIAAASAGVAFKPQPVPSSAYTYLFQSQEQFANR